MLPFAAWLIDHHNPSTADEWDVLLAEFKFDKLPVKAQLESGVAGASLLFLDIEVSSVGRGPR